ncbi:MAG: hypothetical protein R2745_17315 [Vicinamibacterales bacterium]
MKNIQVIDGADNAVYDVFAAPDDVFDLVFPQGTDVAFIEDINQRPDAERVFKALETIWANRLPKSQAQGIHGLLFYQLLKKRQYYPTLRDEEAINPDGTRLR